MPPGPPGQMPPGPGQMPPGPGQMPPGPGQMPPGPPLPGLSSHPGTPRPGMPPGPGQMMPPGPGQMPPGPGQMPPGPGQMPPGPQFNSGPPMPPNSHSQPGPYGAQYGKKFKASLIFNTDVCK